TSIVFSITATATTEIYTLSLHDALPISDRHPLAGDLRAHSQRDPFVRLHVDEQHVRPQAVTRDLGERRMRRALELDRDRRLARRSEEHTSELQSLAYLVCRLLLAKKNNT